MNAARLFSCLTASLFLTLAANAQQLPPNPVTAACGRTTENFSVKSHRDATFPLQPPPRSALVYLIEMLPDHGISTSKVNIGLDGKWIGATTNETHISFVVSQGTHHLCAVYQGHADSMDDEGGTLLLKLKAEAGHTYYIRYHATLFHDNPGIAFFDQVDDDEGILLTETTDEATSTLKK